MRLKQNISSKQKFSQTLKSWFPILKANISDLEKDINEYIIDNPYVSVKSGFEKEITSLHTRKTYKEYISNSRSDSIEALTFETKSYHEMLFDQIQAPLFPTKISQKVAFDIIEHLDENGYFEGNISSIAKSHNLEENDIEKIRLRFAHIDPVGVGAVDLKESFLFQLNNINLDDKLFTLANDIIISFENPIKYKSEPLFKNAMKIIKSFRNPPLLDFLESDTQVIPDIFIYNEPNKVDVRLNIDYYPTISIDTSLNYNEDFLKSKIKEAKNLVDALEMRKATLYKIGLMIVEYQYDFFTGGNLKPMKLQDIADEFGHNSSTISRAIANKYIECDRGVIPIKKFFTTAINEETSNESIKDYLAKLVKEENQEKPLSDNKIVDKIEIKFGIKLGRRTVTKYRLQLGIESSSDRKKNYLLMIN